MKQLIICKDKAYPTTGNFNDITTLTEGQIGIYDLSTNGIVSKALTVANGFTSVAVALGRATGKMPFLFPEVDVKSLKITKSTYTDGSTFTATITVPTPEKGKEYTVVVAKQGVVFNERNLWSFTSLAKDAIAANVAKDITNQINANSHTSGVKATYSAGAITITALKAGDGYNVIGADALTGVAPTSVTQGKKAMLDKEYVKDLSSRCRAGKGFQHADMKEPYAIYPGWPEEVDSDKYDMYSLRFAVPRVASKQRDEVVYQVLHIVVPKDATCETTLDTIFGITSTSGGESGKG